MLFDLLGVRGETKFGGQFWHDQVVAGLPAAGLHRLAKFLEVEVQDLAELVEAPAELVNWQMRGKPLDLASSNILFRIAIAVQHAMLVFKDEDEAAQWLRNPQKELGGNTPIRLLTSQPGYDDVRTCLDKLKAQRKPKVEFSREELENVSRIGGEDSDLEAYPGEGEPSGESGMVDD